ncbi:MAG: hypothetical protein G01um101466_842, partial [Parcubacteria group bacterium Gr01-1014_66]
MNEIDQQRIERAIRRNMMRRVYWIGGSIFFVAGIIWLGIIISKKITIVPPGQVYEDLGQQHITLHDALPKEYNSNPPTSGWHFARPAEWGIYKEEQSDQIMIHNLEHGGIWISYKPDTSGDVKKKLESFYEKYGRKIIIT